MQHRFASALGALALAACSNNAIVVELQTGPEELDIAASSLMLPTELRDDSNTPATVRSVDCSSTQICPSSTEVPVACNSAGVCDPAAIQIQVPIGDVVDFQEILSSAGTLLRLVDAVEIVSVTYSVANSLTVDVPAVTILWGPESATATSSGLTSIGTLPGFAASETSVMGMMDVDQAGSDALSDYIVHTAWRVRFFASTSVDLNPGDRFPDGMAAITVNIRVRAIGRIVN